MWPAQLGHTYSKPHARFSNEESERGGPYEQFTTTHAISTQLLHAEKRQKRSPKKCARREQVLEKSALGEPRTKNMTSDPCSLFSTEEMKEEVQTNKSLPHTLSQYYIPSCQKMPKTTSEETRLSEKHTSTPESSNASRT